MVCEVDNRANQLNPNNDAYYSSRGMDERPNNAGCLDLGDIDDDEETDYENGLDIPTIIVKSHWKKYNSSVVFDVRKETNRIKPNYDIPLFTPLKL